MTIRIIKTKCTKCRKETNHEVKTPSFEEGYMNLITDGTLPVGQIRCLKCGCTKLLL
jgi:hypothetical protein